MITKLEVRRINLFLLLPSILIHLIWICEYFFNHNYYNKHEKISTKYSTNIMFKKYFESLFIYINDR